MDGKGNVTLTPAVVTVHPALTGAAIMAEEVDTLLIECGLKRTTRQAVIGRAAAETTRRVKETFGLNEEGQKEPAPKAQEP